MPLLRGDVIGAIMTLLGHDGVNFRNVRVDAAGHLQVDALTVAIPPDASTETSLAALLAYALTNPLPTGAATAAHQVTQNTALQLIDNLVNALQSVATDRLKVRGEDQLWNYAGSLANFREAVISGANGYVESNTPPATQVWCVQHIVTKDATSPTTAHAVRYNRGGAVSNIDLQTAAFAANQQAFFHQPVYLDPGDVFRVLFTGALAGDACRVDLQGSIMTLEA